MLRVLFGDTLPPRHELAYGIWQRCTWPMEGVSPIIYHFCADVDCTFEMLTTVAADGRFFIGQRGGSTCGIDIICHLAMTS